MTAPAEDDGWDAYGSRFSWGIGDEDIDRLRLAASWPHPVNSAWAWGSNRGEGVRVCVLDSGVEKDHPRIGPVEESYTVQEGNDGTWQVVEDVEGDVCGHGSACAGIVRELAPGCGIVSVRVLGMGMFGSGQALIAGLRWAIQSDAQVINMSLSTTKPEITRVLYQLADMAYFRKKLLVASAHNNQIISSPWRFSSVISVASHSEGDPELVLYNPHPPAEFFARGEKVKVAWLKGGSMTCSGNSFATPHVSALCARILGAHPEMTPFQVKTILYLTSANVLERT
jgi:subtilisin